jgi:hypothetical protein
MTSHIISGRITANPFVRSLCDPKRCPTPTPDLKIISSRVFRGPNIWHYEPVIQLVVDLGVLEDFPTNQLPGFADALVERLPSNEVDVEGRTVIVDYCHNAPGMIMLGDFVDQTGDALESTNDLGRISCIGVIATAGDRRNDDMHALGHQAAQHFDVLIVREDTNLRARAPDEVAQLVANGARQAIAEGARCKQVEVVLEELPSVRHAMSRSNPSDLVVICVEQHAAVMAYLESYGHHAQPGARREDDREISNAVPDPDPTEL